MDESKITGNAREALRRLTAPFFAQGTRPLYVATCCGRLFAGEIEPVKCRVCGRKPAAVSFENEEAVDLAAIPNNPAIEPLEKDPKDC